MTRIVEGSRCGVSGLNMSISRMRTVAWVMEDVHSHDWQKQVTAQCSPAVIFEKEIRFLLFYLSSVPHCCSAVWDNPRDGLASIRRGLVRGHELTPFRFAHGAPFQGLIGVPPNDRGVTASFPPRLILSALTISFNIHV